jgi:hypothetical protein
LAEAECGDEDDPMGEGYATPVAEEDVGVRAAGMGDRKAAAMAAAVQQYKEAMGDEAAGEQDHVLQKLMGLADEQLTQAKPGADVGQTRYAVTQAEANKVGFKIARKSNQIKKLDDEWAWLETEQVRIAARFREMRVRGIELYNEATKLRRIQAKIMARLCPSAGESSDEGELQVGRQDETCFTKAECLNLVNPDVQVHVDRLQKQMRGLRKELRALKPDRKAVVVGVLDDSEGSDAGFGDGDQEWLRDQASALPGAWKKSEEEGDGMASAGSGAESPNRRGGTGFLAAREQAHPYLGGGAK